MGNTRFNTRAFVSLLTGLSFFVMAVTGIVLYIVPQGRIAYWTDWRLLGLTKTDWGNVHILSSIVFALAGSYHLYLNWKPFLAYTREKALAGARLKKEFVIATLAIVFVVASGILNFPPLGYLLDLSARIKDSWVTSKEFEPPFGHAEQLSLRSLAQRMGIDPTKAREVLEQAGITVADPSESLEKIARKNRKSPMEVYRVIRPLERTSVPATVTAPQDSPRVEGEAGRRGQRSSVPVYTVEIIEQEFAGRGLGRKSFADACAEFRIDPVQAREKLAAHNMTVKDAESLKDAAARYETTPIEIVKIILLGEPIRR